MSTRTVWQIGLPLVVLALAIAAFVRVDPLTSLVGGGPPGPPQLTVERVVVDDSGFHLTVRGGGPGALDIAQVQVNEAYWRFQQTPPGPVARGSTVRIDIPFPWVSGEPHEVRLFTADGSTIDHTIEVTTRTPQLTAGRLAGYTLVGLFVGVLPIAIGMAFFPVLRRAGTLGLGFALALTLGLLAFLLADTLLEALDAAARAAPLFEAEVLVWLVAVASFAAIVLIGRRHGAPRGYALAGYLALGIGIHNLGEGLAIGGAVAAGELALGAFLVLGFTLHNVTEGVGIATPIVRERVRPLIWIGLIMLSGLPAVAGIWIGVQAVAPQWAAVCLAIGTGAIAQVLLEVGDLLRRTAVSSTDRWTALAGFLAGIAIMYATALLVQA